MAGQPATSAPSLRPALGIVVPARDEELRIKAVIEDLRSVLGSTPATLIVVVDDGSSDTTAEAARRAGAAVIRHPLNLGKGAALLTGCEFVAGRGCGVIAVMDADGQHLASDVLKLVRTVESGAADLAIGYRPFQGSMPALMRLGNLGLSKVFGLFFGRRFTDTQCGLRAFTATAFQRLQWEATGYSVETEMLVNAARARLRVAEVEIETVYHDRYKGTSIADGARVFADMLRWTVGHQ